MSILIRCADTALSLLPARLSVRIMHSLRPVLPLVSARHRSRFDVLKKLAGPGWVIQYGIFAGMKYFGYARGSALLPKFAGTYELELREALRQIVEMSPDIIADIGSAEGYYLIGLARLIPSSRILGYDLDAIANAMAKLLAETNHVEDRVTIRGRCSPAELETAIGPAKRPVVICDAEGAEDDLLQPNQTPSCAAPMSLLSCTIRNGLAYHVASASRFDPTHHIQVFSDAPRDKSMLPSGLELSEEEARLALDEGRQAVGDWYWMLPRPDLAQEK